MDTYNPQIYVACLAAYNSGYLHGQWIDATLGEDYIRETIQAILATSPIPHAEEWAIHATEDFGDLVSEYKDITTVAEMAEFIVEHSILGINILKYTGSDVVEAKRLMNDCYYGEYDSEEDFAQSLIEETTIIPENIAYYIDYERIANDLLCSDFFSIRADRKYHIFSNR